MLGFSCGCGGCEFQTRATEGRWWWWLAAVNGSGGNGGGNRCGGGGSGGELKWGLGLGEEVF
jgi:hypothetical protein